MVVKVGSKVSRFKSGDEVFARLDKSTIGSFAQYAAVRESDAALKPANLTHRSGVDSRWAWTSWQVMRDMVGLKPGQLALIHAGPGGVGTLRSNWAKSWVPPWSPPQA